MEGFTSIILAAGMGTRMKSEKPKVIHEVCGKPLCKWVIEQSEKAGAEDVIAVIGHKAELVKETLGGCCRWALQSEQKGTGHAVMQTADMLVGKTGVCVILNGDTPLITAETIREAVEYHISSKNQATVITAELDDATGYGRIVRNAEDEVVRIVEQKDASEEEKRITEINSGMYVFDIESLLSALDRITPNNAQGEYYLTDTLEIIRNDNKRVGAFVIGDNDEIRGINDRFQLYEAEKIMTARINKAHMKNGVTIHMPETVYIEDGVQIGADTEIFGNVFLKGNTKIGRDCLIGQGSRIENGIIADRVTVQTSVILDSSVGSDTNVGPFAYIRPYCTVGEDVKVGDFVELKNSNIGSGTKVSHLTYIGDSDVGENCNFGCGTVTVNYDGSKKYRCTIGDNAFIGCNSNLVAPITIGDGGYTAAGSTITDEVPENALAIARARQVNKTEWNDRRKK